MTLDNQLEVLETNSDTDAYYATYSYPTTPPSVAVARAIAELTDQTPTDLDSLHHAATVNPEALDNLFRPSATAYQPDGEVLFHYQNYSIRVKSYGRIIIQETDTQNRHKSNAGLQG